MKKSLQKAQVYPEKLMLIGWGPKSDSQLQQIPGQPIELAIVDKQNGIVNLTWKKPVNGGTIYKYIYIIEKRYCKTNQSDNWTIEAISYDCQEILTNQPKGVQLEYRVKASNLAGQSLPSNTVTITL